MASRSGLASARGKVQPVPAGEQGENEREAVWYSMYCAGSNRSHGSEGSPVGSTSGTYSASVEKCPFIGELTAVLRRVVRLDGVP